MAPETHVIRLQKIDHVCLRVGDVAEAAPRYAIQFGLTIRDVASGRATLACDYEPFVEPVRVRSSHFLDEAKDKKDQQSRSSITP